MRENGNERSDENRSEAGLNVYLIILLTAVSAAHKRTCNCQVRIKLYSAAHQHRIQMITLYYATAAIADD